MERTAQFTTLVLNSITPLCKGQLIFCETRAITIHARDHHNIRNIIKCRHVVLLYHIGIVGDEMQ